MGVVLGVPDFYGLFFFMLMLVLDCVLVFVNVYFLALFSDLETDHIYPTDMCRHVNMFVVPEMVLHGAIAFFLLIKGSWVMVVLNLPLVGWHIYRFVTKKHRLDPTQIFRDRPTETKILYAKLGFYILCFCGYLFLLITSALGH